MGIEDSYTAYCFDEACAYIEDALKAGKRPIYRRKVSSMQEFFKDVLGGDEDVG